MILPAGCSRSAVLRLGSPGKVTLMPPSRKLNSRHSVRSAILVCADTEIERSSRPSATRGSFFIFFWGAGTARRDCYNTERGPPLAGPSILEESLKVKAYESLLL